MAVLDDLKMLIGDVLELNHRAKELDSSSGLMGTIPEFDSMAVVSLITAIENHFGILVEDDEIDAETFATVGNLHEFVNGKLALT